VPEHCNFLITTGLNYGCQLHSTGRFLMFHAIGSGIFAVVSSHTCGHVYVAEFSFNISSLSLFWDTVVLVSNADVFVYVAGL
jgi:hypothetical protein